MKRKLFSMAMTAAIIVAAVFINSCTKQENDLATPNAGDSQNVSNNDKAIINSILSFKDKIAYINENPGFKSGEEVEVDSAVWYLDATLNLSHAFISWAPMSNFYQDSVFVTIPKSGNAIDMNDLAAAYSELKQKVANVCIAAPGTNKELYIASLSKKEETANEVTVKAYATVGETTPPGDEEPFDMAWMYGDEKGIDPGPDIYDGRDACTELTYWTNYYRYLYVDEENMLYIGTAGEEPYTVLKSELDIFINPDDPQPGDNYYEHLLIYQKQIWGYHELIDVDAMNWYYHKLNYVIYDMVPNNQQEWPNAYHKTFITIIDTGDPATGEGTYGTMDNTEKIIKHQYKVEYRYGIHIEDKTPESIVGN